MKKNILFIFIVFLLYNCSSQTNNGKSRTDSIPPKETKEKVLSISWDFQSYQDQQMTTRTNLSAIINQKKYEIAKDAQGSFTVIEKKDFAQLKIPETALTACYGFWAGSQQNIYAETIGDSLFFKEGYLDEMGSATDKIKFSELKKFKISELAN